LTVTHNYCLGMLLGIDIGNSNVVIGCWSDDQWVHVWRLPTLVQEDSLIFYQTRLRSLLLDAGINHSDLNDIVISTVVPDLAQPFTELSARLTGQPPILVNAGWYHLLKFDTESPSEMGSDLFANAIAANRMLRSDCIIIDFGTALTFTTLTAEGLIRGVAIAPGLKTAMGALYQKTAQLPEVPLELPRSVLGTNTQHAIQSGVLIGYVGLVKHMVSTIREETGAHYKTIATGGLSSILHPLSSSFDMVDPHLTLNGLRLIAEANHA
jgi:type III pantothenate kinase